MLVRFILVVSLLVGCGVEGEGDSDYRSERTVVADDERVVCSTADREDGTIVVCTSKGEHTTEFIPKKEVPAQYRMPSTVYQYPHQSLTQRTCPYMIRVGDLYFYRLNGIWYVFIAEQLPTGCVY